MPLSQNLIKLDLACFDESQRDQIKAKQSILLGLQRGHLNQRALKKVDYLNVQLLKDHIRGLLRRIKSYLTITHPISEDEAQILINKIQSRDTMTSKVGICLSAKIPKNAAELVEQLSQTSSINQKSRIVARYFEQMGISEQSYRSVEKEFQELLPFVTRYFEMLVKEVKENRFSHCDKATAENALKAAYFLSYETFTSLAQQYRNEQLAQCVGKFKSPDMSIWLSLQKGFPDDEKMQLLLRTFLGQTQINHQIREFSSVDESSYLQTYRVGDAFKLSRYLVDQAELEPEEPPSIDETGELDITFDAKGQIIRKDDSVNYHRFLLAIDRALSKEDIDQATALVDEFILRLDQLKIRIDKECKRIDQRLKSEIDQFGGNQTFRVSSIPDYNPTFEERAHHHKKRLEGEYKYPKTMFFRGLEQMGHPAIEAHLIEKFKKRDK